MPSSLLVSTVTSRTTLFILVQYSTTLLSFTKHIKCRQSSIFPAIKPQWFWIHTAVSFWQLCVCECVKSYLKKKQKQKQFSTLLDSSLYRLSSLRTCYLTSSQGVSFLGRLSFLRLVGISEQMELIAAFLLAHPTGLRGPDLVAFALVSLA